MVSTELTNFFTASLPVPQQARPFIVLQNGNQATGKFLQQRVDLAVAFGAAEVRQVQRDASIARRLGQVTPRMGARIRAQKRLLGGGRKMADVENGIEMLHRHRDRVGRIGNLADEAAILAHRMREPDAHARGPAVEHFLEDALVGGDGARFALSLERRFRHDLLRRRGRRSSA
jgi:hypothetical protein